MMAVPSTRPPGAAPAAAPRTAPRPVPVVAMVGGGQLARMTHQAAIALGQSLRVLATAADEPAALVAPDVVIGSHTEIEDLRRVAAGADVLTRIRQSAAARPNTRRAARDFPAGACTGTPCRGEWTPGAPANVGARARSNNRRGPGTDPGTLGL